MEKLTEYVDGKYIRIKGTKSLYPKNERDGAPLSNAIARLAAYEETGLEPEEIEHILDSYGRGMTLRTENAQRLEIIKEISTNRLRELSQADRDGRCLIVPVKLGQPVYCLQKYFNDATMKSEKRVKCRIVDFIQVASKMFEANGLIYRFSEIGKTVFLTREAAEAALKEREAIQNVLDKQDKG